MKKYASSEHTKSALVNAAGELAAEMGFSNISTRAIAERAGENIGSIHYHFGGKDKLFEAVIHEVIARGNNFSVADAIAPFSDSLNTREGQLKALRAVVNKKISSLFDPSFPRWHSRIVYQLMQYKCPLQEILQKELLNPMVESISELLSAINPFLERDETMLITFLMISPIVSHADYMPFCLDHLGEDHYNDDYLRKMEDFIVKQTEQLLGIGNNPSQSQQ